MSHPGKFVSVNLNRSYGQPAPSHHGARPSRPPGSSSSAGGGGGGMVVLSRSRGGSSVAKPQQPKLSVPPPLNLPSLRKEHERFDGAAAAAGGGVASAPPRSGGPAAGWTKPAPASEKGPAPAPLPGSAARPPSYGFSERAVVLRGEDFPSLKAAVAPPPPPPAQRQKDADGLRATTPDTTRPMPLGMRPQVTASRAAEPLASAGGAAAGSRASATEKAQRHDLEPLPMVRLRYDSDWADDERDTGLSLPERDSRERGFGRCDPMVPGRDLYGGMRDPFKKEPFAKDLAATDKEDGHDSFWRSPISSQQDRERIDGRPYSAGRGINGQSSYRESITGGGSKDLWNGTREPAVRAYGQNAVETYGSARMGEAAGERYGGISNNWYRGNSFQNNVGSKSQTFLGNKGPLISEPVANFGREKRFNGTPTKPLIEDDRFDSIASLNLSAIKKKKEATKPADFHDPVRESFEAELDRILRVQEQERQQVLEEQAKEREVVRKQEEERERLIREEEERQRLVEEEARHAAWQAEQESLEAARRAEEQRIAWEEEKRKVAMEEERRKEAARQKLLDLEARIARRQVQSTMRDGNQSSSINGGLLPGASRERDVLQSVNVGDRQESDRMGGRISTSPLLESSSLNRYNDTFPKAHTSRDGQSSFVDRDHSYFSSRAAFHDQDNAHYSPQRDTLPTRRGNFLKNDSYDGFTTATVGPSLRGQTVDSPWSPEDYRHGRVPGWDAPRENDRFDKQSDFDTEFFSSDRFGDAAWLPSSSRGSPNAQQGDRMFQNSDDNDFPFTRSHYSMRQPRVPPPPTVVRSTIGASTQRASSFVNSGMRESSGRDDEHSTRSQRGNAYQEASQQHGTSSEGIAINEQQSGDRESPILGSQSSLSVSSPPSSPPHVSQDEMDVSGDSPALPTSADGDRTVMSDNDHAVSTLDAANTSRVTTSSTVSHLEDDEWPSENNENRQKQDEYDEDINSYQEDVINEADDENLDLDDEFAEGQSTHVEMEPVILGFDEGIQVEIPPNRDVELTSMKNPEKAIGVHSGVMEQEMVRGSVCPSDLVTEAQNTLQDLALDEIASLTDETNGGPSGCSVPSVSSSKLPHKSSAIPSIPSTTAVIGQSEIPVNLQFGLFSGPSLIPTPVPAIQIGSIQMPIHLHNQFNPSLAQVHPSSSPLFQFGQLRYVRPIAQNVRPVSQAIPSTHPSAQAPCILNRSTSSGISNEINRDTQSNIPSEADSHSQKPNAPAINWIADVEGFHNLLDRSGLGENTACKVSRPESHRNHDLSLKRNYKPTPNTREPSQVGTDGKALSGPKAPGAIPGGRGRRYSYAVKEPNVKSTGSVVEHSHKDSRGIQRRSRRNIRRTEFRVRENSEKNHIPALESFSHGEQNENPYYNGTARDISVRHANRRDGDKLFRTNEASDLSAGPSSTSANYHNKTERSAQKAPFYEKSHGGNKKSRSGSIPEGDASTSLEAGVARIVKQQGIEVPVDADGFIEVRSKKQIMSVRREQREKENRSKMRMAKAPRKQHQVSLHSSSSPSLNKGTVYLGEPAKKASLDSVIDIEGTLIDHVEPSVTLKGDATSMTPIGPRATNTESRANYYVKKPIHSQPTSNLVNSSGAVKLVVGLSKDNNKAAPINTPFNMGAWDGSHINQQVMPLTQTQLDEAMKPAKFEQAGSGYSLEHDNASSPAVTTEKAFPSSASPINSLLAGEKIQFGAVTSPTVLVPVSRTISSGLGAPGSSRPDTKIDRSLPGDNNGTDVLFDKEAATTSAKESCTNSEDVKAEAEAEAAASAVAVAAISTDEVVRSATEATTSASNNKSFSSNDLTGLTSGGAITGQTGQTSTEESLTVALPADLSVDTPSMSLWPPMPSPQASGQMLSQFPGSQPSHYSCFDMNTMLGGHIFAYGPSDESAGSQGQQPQRSNALPSAPLGAWPQCHSGVESSFYRPPTGFAGPFITPGGMPGVQGPPHMVVYNHFAPVGQFGQMGLGFMGATYIPSDKQPDWKQNQGPSGVGVNQNDPNNKNMVPGQVTSASIPTQMQHLRAASIMPIPSPLAMFDMSPFQSSTDIQMQPCWPHMPVPPLHSVPLSVPLQQHPIDGTTAPQFVHNVQMDNKASTNNRFQEPSASVLPSDGSKSFPNAGGSQYTDGLSLAEQPASSSSNAQTGQASFVRAGMISNEVPNSARAMVRTNPPNVNSGIATGVTSNPNAGQVASMPAKLQQSSSASDQQYQHPVNNQDRRARVSQKTGPVNEWQRRPGYQGRNQNSGSDKTSGTGRMKQIYVAKSSASGHAPSG